MNYFELFGIKPSFDIDQAAVKQRFYELSRAYHPDFFGNGTEAEQAEALDKSAMVNEAYKTLLNKDIFTKYILTMEGVLQAEEAYQLSPDFLMEVMDLNEQAMEIDRNDTAAVNELRQTVQQLQTEIYESIQPVMADYESHPATEKALLQIKDYYYKKKYLDKILAGLQ
jgi:molecular chaperone HscB